MTSGSVETRKRLEELLSRARDMAKRYFTSGNPNDLSEVLVLGREARSLALSLGDRVAEGACSLLLGQVLSQRYERFGGTSELDEALRFFADADAAMGDGHEERPVLNSSTSIAQFYRYMATGDLAHLSKAIENARAAIDGAAGGDPRLVGWYTNVAGYLRTRAEQEGNFADLDQAIEYGRAATALPPRHPMALAGLASSLLLRFNVRQDDRDLDEALTVAEEAHAATEPGRPDRPSITLMLATGLRLDFERTGSVDRLSRAATLQREVIDGLADGFVELTTHLANLSHLLRVRAVHAGAVGDLEEAVAVAHRAAEVANFATIHHAARAQALALVSRAQWRRAAGDVPGALDDCVAAVAAAERAIDPAPTGHPMLPMLLTLRGNALLVRHETVPNPASVTAAITAYEQALDLCGADDPQRALLLGNLGVLLLEEAAGDDSGESLRRAIERLEAGYELTPPEHPLRAQNAANLAKALYDRADSPGSPDGQARSDRARVVELADAGATATTPPPRLRALLGYLAGSVLMEDGAVEHAIKRFKPALDLQTALAWGGADRHGLERHLVDLDGIGRDTAACLISLGDPGGALESLEQGRGVMWTRTLQLRQRNTALDEYDPALAGRLREIATILQHEGDLA